MQTYLNKINLTKKIQVAFSMEKNFLLWIMFLCLFKYFIKNLNKQFYEPQNFKEIIEANSRDTGNSEPVWSVL